METNKRGREMTQEELVNKLIKMSKSKSVKRDLRTISDKLTEEIDHTILTHMMCLLVENEDHIIDMFGEDDYAWRYQFSKENR